MHTASRPPVPGGIPMGPPLANGPSQGSVPANGDPRLTSQPGFAQQPAPYNGGANGIHPYATGQMPNKLGLMGPQSTLSGQPFPGPVPVRPSSMNGPPPPQSQVGIPPASHPQGTGPPTSLPPRPGSSQGMAGPLGQGSLGQYSSAGFSNLSGPSPSPIPPVNNGPFQTATSSSIQPGFPSGPGFSSVRPSPSPVPQTAAPPLSQGASSHALGGLPAPSPQMGAPQLPGLPGAPFQLQSGQGTSPNFGGIQSSQPLFGGPGTQGIPQPSRGQLPPGPGFNPSSQPLSANLPGYGPPRPEVSMGPNQFQANSSQPASLNGPPRPSMIPGLGNHPSIPMGPSNQPSLPPSAGGMHPSGPGMLPQLPPVQGMHPSMPPGSGMRPPMPQGPGMHPPMPQGPGMHPPRPQGLGMHTPMPQGPGMQPHLSQGPGMHPPMPLGPGMHPQMSQGPGMPPQPGGYNPQMAPGQMSSPGRRSLDPDQMPSPIAVMEDDQANNGGTFQTKDKGMPPPLVTTKFVCQDYGNANPRLIRSTMYTVPASEDLRKQSGVPFALIVSPMAKLAEGEQEPPVTDFGPTGPVRCVRCKAYMCPYMQFIDGGRRFQCAFCKATTEVPADYFQHLDHTGVRMDCYQRPELCLGTYECVATKDYCRDSKEPNTPGIIFAIDVSYPMIKEGVVQLICANIKSMIADLPRDSYCDKAKMRVGFITYDKKINFYNIKSNLTQPQQLTVGDVDDMFVPLVDGLMCDVQESEGVIDSLLEQIPIMFADTRETETILAPVVQAGKEAFKAANCAGKLIIFHHNLPVAEAPGKLKNRDDRKVLGTDKEKTVLVPQVKDYNNLGQECVGVGCSVDMFIFNNAFIDVATISQVCRLSGGQLYKYTYFQPEIDGERFLADLRHNLCRPVVFDAIMRVRTSTGVRPVEFYGNFFMANTTDTEVASLNSDMAVACEIKYDDKLTEEDGVYIQVAVLFTSCSGQRRLRVINLSLKTSTSMADMYRNCEMDTMINFQAKQSMQKLMESNPKSVKEALIANCAQILACYRKNCASPSSAGQLILPECMKLLPLYTNCLLKSDALSGGADVGCDDRAYLMHSLGSMDVSSTVAYFYPRLIPLHDLPEGPNVEIPHPLRCSMEKVTDNGVYLLENGIYMFMYIGLTVDPGWVQAVFGVQGNSQINLEKSRLDERDNPTSEAVRRVIELIRKERQRNYMRLVLVRQRDKLDVLFRHFLCEDRGSPGSGAGDFNFSYVDFLMHMHKEIRALLS